MFKDISLYIVKLNCKSRVVNFSLTFSCRLAICSYPLYGTLDGNTST